MQSKVFKAEILDFPCIISIIGSNLAGKADIKKQVMLHQLNTKGLICPMPLLKLKLLLKQCQVGDYIEQQVTDNRSAKDIPAWLKMKGYCVQVSQLDGDVYLLKVKVNQPV